MAEIKTILHLFHPVDELTKVLIRFQQVFDYRSCSLCRHLLSHLSHVIAAKIEEFGNVKLVQLLC